MIISAYGFGPVTHAPDIVLDPSRIAAQVPRKSGPCSIRFAHEPAHIAAFDGPRSDIDETALNDIGWGCSNGALANGTFSLMHSAAGTRYLPNSIAKRDIKSLNINAPG